MTARSAEAIIAAAFSIVSIHFLTVRQHLLPLGKKLHVKCRSLGKYQLLMPLAKALVTSGHVKIEVANSDINYKHVLRKQVKRITDIKSFISPNSDTSSRWWHCKQSDLDMNHVHVHVQCICTCNVQFQSTVQWGEYCSIKNHLDNFVCNSGVLAPAYILLFENIFIKPKILTLYRLRKAILWQSLFKITGLIYKFWTKIFW